MLTVPASRPIVPVPRPWWWWLAAWIATGWLAGSAWVIYRAAAGWPVL